MKVRHCIFLPWILFILCSACAPKQNYVWIKQPVYEYDDVTPFIEYSSCLDGDKLLTSFSHSLIISEGKTGVIDCEGEVTIPVEKDIQISANGEIFDKEGNCLSVSGENKEPEILENTEYYYDIKENKIIYNAVGITEYTDYSDNAPKMLQCVSVASPIPNNEGFLDFDFLEKYVLVDQKGKLVIDTQFDACKSQTYGLFPVNKGGKWGYIDETGKNTIPYIYDDACPFSSGNAAVSKDGKAGFIDINGKVVVDFDFEQTRPAYQNKAWVRKDGKWGIIQLSE